MPAPDLFELTAAAAVYSFDDGFYQLQLTFNARRASGGISNSSIAIVGATTIAVPAQTRPAGITCIFNSAPCAPGALGAGPASLDQLIDPSELERESDSAPCSNVEGFPVTVFG